MTRLGTPDPETQIVGRPERRIEGPPKVTGAATHADKNAKMGNAWACDAENYASKETTR